MHDVFHFLISTHPRLISTYFLYAVYFLKLLLCPTLLLRPRPRLRLRLTSSYYQ